MRATLELYRDCNHVLITFDDIVVPYQIEQSEFRRNKSRKLCGDSDFECVLVDGFLEDDDVSCVEVFEQWSIAVRYIPFDYDHQPSIDAVKANLTKVLVDFSAHLGEQIEIRFDESFEPNMPEELSDEKHKELEDRLLEEEVLEDIRSSENNTNSSPGSNVDDIVKDWK